MDQDEIKRQFTRAYTRALKLIAHRPRSIKELSDYFQKKQIDSLIIEQVIEHLKKENLLNDQEFASWWTEQRQEFKQKSNIAIRTELRQKGVTDTDIERALNAGEDELKMAQKLWSKHSKRFDGLSGRERFEKAGAFLQRKGFSFEIIKKVLNEHD